MAKKPVKTKMGPKFGPTEHEEVLVEVGRLDRMGLSQYEIARRVKVSQPMVSGYLAKVRERYKRSILAERHEAVVEQLELLKDVRRRAFEALDESGKDWRKVLLEELSNQSGDGGYRKRAETTEARTPAAEYMRIILDTVKQTRELLGLDEVVKLDIELKGAVTTTTLAPADFFALLSGQATVSEKGEVVKVVQSGEAVVSEEDPIKGKIEEVLDRSRKALNPPSSNGKH